MRNNRSETISWVLRVAIAFLFLISAVAKMYPSPYFAISTFEVKQLYTMGFSPTLAAYFSRTLIGIEFALGILLLQRHYLKRFVVPATFFMLVVFTAHLAIQTFMYGNSGNCGCFGSLLPMTPVEAIIKNVVAMGLLVVLFFTLPKRNENRDNFWIITTVVFAFILMVFMLAPMQPEPARIQTEIPVHQEELPLEVADPKPEVDVPAPAVKTDTATKILPKIVSEPPKKRSGYAQYFADIDKGKKVLCFFVPGCDHCRDAAKELTEMKARSKNFPKIEIIFMNEEADLIPDFFKSAGAQYPYTIIEVIPFWRVLGEGKDTPGVKYLWNGNEYVYYYGITDNKFNAGAFEKLVNKPYPELKK